MGRLEKLWRSRWLVLVASMWLQACAGVGYVFGSYSPLIKAALGYNQRQINVLGVAKDIGDNVGLLAGYLCDILPLWALLLLGSLHNIFGYGWIWLAVSSRVPVPPFWLICILICLGTNGDTYFNTAALVSSVRNFPHSRGTVVGILKAFAGLCGAIFSQIYTAFLAPEEASFLFIVAVGPAMVATAVMFIIRPLHSSPREDGLESLSFRFIYSVCLVIAAYLMGVMLLQDLVPISELLSIMFAVGLIFLLFLPLAVPIYMAVFSTKGMLHGDPILPLLQSLKSPLLDKSKQNPSLASVIGEGTKPQDNLKNFEDPYSDAMISTESEDERGKQEPLRPKRLARLRSSLLRAIAEGAIRVKHIRSRGPRRGEDFTLSQALIKADFWLLFLGLFCGAGSGLTVIDNIGQMSESFGYSNPHIFVSLISIWNFLGRLAGGYTSEIVARDFAFPRPLMMAIAQVIMAVGHFSSAMAWPGSLYVGSLLVGLGYGAHWSIVPATASELFGLKNFGLVYNFLAIANPMGSLIFSGVIAGSLYDWQTAKQKGITSMIIGSTATTHDSDLVENNKCVGAICFYYTFLIMTTVCLLGASLSTLLVVRTRRVYLMLYGKQQREEKLPEGSGRVNPQKTQCLSSGKEEIGKTHMNDNNNNS